MINLDLRLKQIEFNDLESKTLKEFRLIRKTDFQELLSCIEEAKELITYLKKTPYEQECDEWISKYFK